MCSVSWQSEPSVCLLSTKAKSRAKKQSQQGALGAKSIVKPCTVFSASRPPDTFNRIKKKKKKEDVSLAATYSYAPRPQQHGSGAPPAAKCPLWKLQRQSLRSLTTTALVLQFLFWRDRCQVIQINTWGGGGQPLFPCFPFPSVGSLRPRRRADKAVVGRMWFFYWNKYVWICWVGTELKRTWTRQHNPEYNCLHYFSPFPFTVSTDWSKVNVNSPGIPITACDIVTKYRGNICLHNSCNCFNFDLNLMSL